MPYGSRAQRRRNSSPNATLFETEGEPTSPPSTPDIELSPIRSKRLPRSALLARLRTDNPALTPSTTPRAMRRTRRRRTATPTAGTGEDDSDSSEVLITEPPHKVEESNARRSPSPSSQSEVEDSSASHASPPHDNPSEGASPASLSAWRIAKRRRGVLPRPAARVRVKAPKGLSIFRNWRWVTVASALLLLVCATSATAAVVAARTALAVCLSGYVAFEFLRLPRSAAARRAASSLSGLLIGHRGCRGLVATPTVKRSGSQPFLVPEQSMASFRVACDAGAEGVELDVKLTKDGVPVVFHSHFVNALLCTDDGRSLPAETAVSDLTLAELRELRFRGFRESLGCEGRVPSTSEPPVPVDVDVGVGDEERSVHVSLHPRDDGRVPTLEEVLHWAVRMRMRVFVELKEVRRPREAAVAVSRVISEAHARKLVVVISFDFAALWHIRRVDAKVRHPSLLLATLHRSPS